MADEGRTTISLPVQTGPVDSNDSIVFIYNIGANANFSNGVAQTALLAIKNLFANTPNLQFVAANLNLSDIRSDPANSTALTIPAGTVFFSNSFVYFATANNHTKRVSLSDY